MTQKIQAENLEQKKIKTRVLDINKFVYLKMYIDFFLYLVYHVYGLKIAPPVPLTHIKMCFMNYRAILYPALLSPGLSGPEVL